MSFELKTSECEKLIDKKLYQINSKASSIKEIFPDKLKYLKGYRVRIICAAKYPVFFIKGRHVLGTGVNFIDNFARHHKASSIYNLIIDEKKFHRKLQEKFYTDMVDISPNAVFIVSEVTAGSMHLVN